MNRIRTLLATLIAVLPLTSLAAPITFDLEYSGASFGNAASASGFIAFDDSVLPVPGSLGNVTAATVGVTDFSITVSGASAGNGTFGLADVTNWVWIVGAGLDLTTQLVGQAAFNDFNWCAAGFVGCIAPAPGGVAAFTIRANAEQGERMRLTSMARSVPEPGTLALLGIGLLGLGFGRRASA